MPEIAIKIENVAKQYRLGQVGTGTISHDLNRWWKQLRGKENPYLKIGETNDRTNKGKSNYVWALQNIDFEVKKGEVLGIIGKNGAGKSTLLKILSKVTGPTIGTIKAKGRIASLLEVGTGFHPEMTGRENIYMNGTIMGMTRQEISAKLDEIVEFAGISRYLDTPVKRYSSGMTVRLGFSIAAHLEPEILVVDEVLAVGDAEFQKKAIGKMQDVSKEGGRTVLFVTHNMASVKALCTKAIVLHNGEIAFNGDTEGAIDYYMNQSIEEISLERTWENDSTLENENLKIHHIKISPKIGEKLTIESGVKFDLSFINYNADTNIAIGFTIFSLDDTKVFESTVILSKNNDSKLGEYNITGELNPFILNSGIYRLKIVFGQNASYVLYKNDNILQFELDDTFFDRGTNFSKVTGICRPNLNWTSNFIKND